MKGKKFINNKTGDVYTVLFDTVQDSETLERKVVYANATGVLFDRPYDLFLEKFTPVVCLEQEAPITSANYVEAVLRTEPKDLRLIKARLQSDKIVKLLHATMGIATEGGELLDALKKHIFYGKPLDIVNLKEEIGATEWYAGLAVSVLGTTFDEILHGNIEKLKKRYPEKFTEGDALNRNTDNELSHFQV